PRPFQNEACATSKAPDESARPHYVVNMVVRRLQRKGARARVNVTHVGAESDPAEAAHVHAAAELQSGRIRVALLRVGTAIRAELRLAVARVACAQRTEDRH